MCWMIKLVLTWIHVVRQTDRRPKLYNKEDRAEATLGILIKIPPNFLLNLSLITLHDVPS